MVGEVAGAYVVEHLKEYWDFSRYEPLLCAGTISQKVKSWLFMASR